MIRLLQKGEAALKIADFEALAKNPAPLQRAIWIDLLRPTPEEEEMVRQKLGVEILTKEEMHEIEESSRLFESNGALYMSCWLISFDSVIPENTSVTFVAAPKFLLSIRHSDHHPFRIFCNASKRVQTRPLHSPDDAFVELLDAMVNQVASTLRQVEQSLNQLSLEIFTESAERGTETRKGNLKDVVQKLGKRNALVSNLRESSVSFQSIIPYLSTNASAWLSPDLTAKLKTLDRDMRSLREYDAQLSAEINFLLDSTVGLISIQQNQSMKILSVAALVLAFI